MLTNRDLQELLNFKSEHAVVSVYLNTDPAEGNSEVHRLNLRSLLKNVEDRVYTEIIERFFDHEFDWSGRSVALFSCPQEDFFQTYSLMIPVKNKIYVGDRPYIKTLADLLDLYGGYGVAVVDKQGTRCLAFHVGELIDEKEFQGETIRKVKHGGGSQSSGTRGGETSQTQDIDEIAERNMKEAGEFVSQFFKEHNVRRVLLGGSEDNISLFRPHLSKTWQSLIIGTFPISKRASAEQILNKILEIGKEAEHSQEKELVNSLITNTAKGLGGVLTLDETLSAVHEGRVRTLLLDQGYHAPGYRCKGCGFITTQQMETCPFCGNQFERIEDAVELAVRKVLQLGGEVEVLQGDVSLKEHGHIGAILRY